MSTTSRRQPSACIVNRRGFFSALVREIVVAAGSSRGRTGYALADLSSLPDEVLSWLVPAVNPAFEIIVESGWLCGRNRNTGADIHLFELTAQNVYVFNRFDGFHTLSEIATDLSSSAGWELQDAFAFACDLFLLLARQYVCMPANPPEEHHAA